jgi:ABC-type branched-subunit amino acid transport system ATPase component
MLELQDLRIGYGGVDVVSGVSFSVAAGEVVGVIGPNGAGKTSILRAIAGLRRPRSGRIALDGERIDGLPAERLADMGLALVPEGRHIFKTLTVEENLRLAVRGGESDSLKSAFDRFPILAERAGQPADRLSGGEQQQLAIARALIRHPRLLVLDEPSLGLAPRTIETIYALLGELREEGKTMLLVEQNAARTIEFCDRCLVISRGRVGAEGSREDLRANPATVRAYLGGQL